jgi:hypothetical protein
MGTFLKEGDVLFFMELMTGLNEANREAIDPERRNNVPTS